MHGLHSFDYAVLRVVPRVDREEFLNVGIVLSCIDHHFLDTRISLNPAKLQVLAPEIDLELVTRHLNAYARVAAGDPAAGPVASLNRRQRFHWLTAPRSTILQVSPVHTGLCRDPRVTIDELFQRLVL
jgi:hypothetical protein